MRRRKMRRRKNGDSLKNCLIKSPGDKTSDSKAGNDVLDLGPNNNHVIAQRGNP